MVQRRLLFLLLALLAVVSITKQQETTVVESLLYDDAVMLKKELEAHAWKLLRLSTEIMMEKQSDGTTDGEDDGLLLAAAKKKAETILREAIATAPWIPEPYATLANHLLEHGDQKRDIREVFDLYRTAMRTQHALPRPSQNVSSQELLLQLHKRPSFSKHFQGSTFPSRLRHDRDQLELLGQRGKLPVTIVDRFLTGYDVILSKILHDKLELQINLPLDFWARTIGSVYQRALYVPEIEPLQGPALNPNLDFASIEEQYLSSDPNFATIENLLTEEALLKLRQYYEEATVFWDAKQGYVGSYIFDGGFGNSVITQLVEELMEVFPRLICTHRLTNAWAYKYDSEIAQPIPTHADMAAVNFNLWISPDEGSLDKETGGLVVYKVVPPEGTPMEVFNQWPPHDDVTRMLEETNRSNFTIPFKSNRAVVFQSSLFHASGSMDWAAGYSKRRLNLTFLFGKMYDKCKNSSGRESVSPKEEL